MPFSYQPPGDLTDFNRSAVKEAELKENWNRFIAARIGTRDGGLFFDAANDDSPGAAARAPIPWNAFPRSIWQWFNADSDPAGARGALATADVLRPFVYVVRNGFVQRINTDVAPALPPLRRVINGQLGAAVQLQARQQDEYCEWHVDRDSAGKIIRIAYTSEGPEYWEEMARIDPDLVLALYREFVNPAVAREEIFWDTPIACADLDRGVYVLLFQKDEYDPFNKWNTTNGVMHLTHGANTLGAEINLAADATVLRPGVSATPPATLPFRLVCCGVPAGVNRSSDPLIVAGVNGLAREGRAVTLANPVGLYMSQVDIDGLRGPSNTPIGSSCLQLPRRSADGTMVLRAEVRPPAGATFTLSDCRFDGLPLEFGGQIARKITMVLFGTHKEIPGRTGEEEGCTSKCCGNPDAPNFIKTFSPTQNCSQLSASDFQDEAPFQGAGGTAAFVSPPTAALAGSGLDASVHLVRRGDERRK
jgi:hypothetical protein